MRRLGYGGETMFVIVVYDVHKTRCAKVMKYLRQWLEHRQRSVFSGFLSESQVELMKIGLMQITVTSYDSVIIFQSNRATQIKEWTTMGAERARATSMIVNTGTMNGRERGKRDVGRSRRKKKNGCFFRMSALQKQS